MKLFSATDRYIFRLVIVPMLGVFALAASLLMMEKMLRLFEFVSTEGGPVGVVFKMLLNVIPEYAGLAIPLGLLLGTLLAFRKLAISSELDVMRAVGLSYTRLLFVPYVLTVFLMAVNLAIVGYIQPLSRYAYMELDYELRSGALGASISVGEFTQLEDRVALRIEASKDEGRQLMGIFARVANDEGQVLSITARQGQFLANRENRNTIILRLEDGTIVHDIPGQTPRVLSFSQHDLPIDLPAIDRFRERGEASREFILHELFEMGWKKDVTTAEKLGGQANFNYRLVEVVMMLMMPLLAVSLAIPPKRSTSSLGIFVAIVIVVSYHKVNQYGQSVAELGRLDPVYAFWVPFAILAAWIGWMYYKVAFVPGGQAIGFLETGFSKLAKNFKRLLKRNRSSQLRAYHEAEAADVS